MNNNTHILAATCFLLLSSTVSAESLWYVKPVVGLNYLSDTSGSTRQLGSTNGTADVDLDTGFMAGLGIGRDINDHLSFEITWEYRSADSYVTLADDTVFPDGNYASNMFFFNTHYHLNAIGDWKPYVGAGLGWVQEIDLDLESNGVETSLSGENEVAPQIFIGANYPIKEGIDLGLELRYTRVGTIELMDEGETSASFSPDYNPLSLQVGLSFDL